MKLNIEEITETRKKFTVVVAAEEIADEEKKITAEFNRNARVPGFRQGKAPLNIIKQRFARDIKTELNRSLSQKAYQTMSDEGDSDIYQVVDFTEGNFTGGGEAEVIFTVDINPVFNLPDYKGIETEVESVEVSDEEVEQAIVEMQKQRSDFKVVERAANKGDYVKVSYEGKIGDELIKDIVPDKPIYGTQENTWEEAGAEESFGVKAIIEAVTGMQAGDTATVNQKFEDDFEIEALAGKEATYSITVSEVRERILPELDASFLESLKVESAEELKDKMLTDLEAQKKNKVHQAKIRQIEEELRARIEFPLPESAVENETQNVMRQVMTQEMRRGISQEEIMKNSDQLMEFAKRSALNRVKENIILRKIAEKESIEVTEQDMQQYIIQQAMASRTPIDKFVKDLKKDADQIKAIRDGLLLSKTLDFIAGEAKEIPHVHTADCGHDH